MTVTHLEDVIAHLTFFYTGIKWDLAEFCNVTSFCSLDFLIFFAVEHKINKHRDKKEKSKIKNRNYNSKKISWQTIIFEVKSFSVIVIILKILR